MLGIPLITESKLGLELDTSDGAEVILGDLLGALLLTYIGTELRLGARLGNVLGAAVSSPPPSLGPWLGSSDTNNFSPHECPDLTEFGFLLGIPLVIGSKLGLELDTSNGATVLIGDLLGALLLAFVGSELSLGPLRGNINGVAVSSPAT